ncbi:MFS transporter [Rhizomonospora bruguierae]|uniref:MFS transporter n=1 Tax=Rhizomonospora bruguierae TaxID=1581705 RepID=UPI001BCAF719|nr:MFS transporter [Micromonospora sp. NBRC 107566]
MPRTRWSGRTRRIDDWNPEDQRFWAERGRRVARRNLAASILSEHLGFSVWTMWSVLVLFLTPRSGASLDPADKFLVVVTPTLVGALLRLPYSAGVARFGGRTWTLLASLLLAVPTLGAWYLVQRPGAPLWGYLLVAASAGVGGATFGSSMTYVGMLFPQHRQGLVLGLNAGGGNLGVAAVQLVGVAVIAVAGTAHPALLPAVYLPAILVAAAVAARYMDDIVPRRRERPALAEACRSGHTWWISALYVGSFGSFIGYGFALGIVLQTEFGWAPLAAASAGFVGPLLGSAARPVGGWLADRYGGARVTFAAFLGMALGTGGLLVAAAAGSATGFLAGFVALFLLSGAGNGSVYKMIPAVFAAEAARAVLAGEDARGQFARARRLTGAVIGIGGAVGALGGVAINLAFRAAYAGGPGGGARAFVAFLAGYAGCLAITWFGYLGGRARRRLAVPEATLHADRAAVRNV